MKNQKYLARMLIITLCQTTAVAACQEDPHKKVLRLNDTGLEALEAGEFPRAEEFFQKAVGVSAKCSAKDPARGTVVDNLGLALKKQGQYKKAQEVYLRAYRWRQKNLGSEHEDVGFSLNNLGALHNDLQQYDKAENYYLQAQKILAKTLPEDASVRLSLSNNLGLLNKRLGRLDKAEHYYKKPSVFEENNGEISIPT